MAQGIMQYAKSRKSSTQHSIITKNREWNTSVQKNGTYEYDLKSHFILLRIFPAAVDKRSTFYSDRKDVCIVHISYIQSLFIFLCRVSGFEIFRDLI